MSATDPFLGSKPEPCSVVGCPMVLRHGEKMGAWFVAEGIREGAESYWIVGCPSHAKAVEAETARVFVERGTPIVDLDWPSGDQEA